MSCRPARVFAKGDIVKGTIPSHLDPLQPEDITHGVVIGVIGKGRYYTLVDWKVGLPAFHQAKEC